MDIETTTYEDPKQYTAADSGTVTAPSQNILDKGTEAYGKAEQAV